MQIIIATTAEQKWKARDENGIAQLEGEKDEVMVRYWLEASEQDYNSYRIGDYYRLVHKNSVKKA